MFIPLGVQTLFAGYAAIKMCSYLAKILMLSKINARHKIAF